MAPLPAAPAARTHAAAARPLNNLALDFGAWEGGRDLGERAGRPGPCAGCGRSPVADVAFIDPAGAAVCRACFSGLSTTEVAPGANGWRGERAMSAHALGVLAPTAAHLLGVSVEDLVTHVPRVRPRATCFKKASGYRVSLRAAAAYALKAKGGPAGLKRARARAARAEAAGVSASAAESTPKSLLQYETMDARARDARRHRLRRALRRALAAFVYAPEAAAAAAAEAAEAAAEAPPSASSATTRASPSWRARCRGSSSRSAPPRARPPAACRPAPCAPARAARASRSR